MCGQGAPENSICQNRKGKPLPYLESGLTPGLARFRGVGGASIQAVGNGFLDVSVGDNVVEGRFVVLGAHEPTLPTLLFGMDILTGELEGVRVKRRSVVFDIAPEVVYDSLWPLDDQAVGDDGVVSLMTNEMPDVPVMKKKF